MAPRFSSSCTRKRINNAGTCALGATLAGQVSGENFFSLDKQGNTRTAETSNELKTRFSLIVSRMMPVQVSPYCCSPTLRESANAATARHRDKKNNRFDHPLSRQRRSRFAPPCVRLKASSSEAVGISCAPPTVFVALRLHSQFDVLCLGQSGLRPFHRRSSVPTTPVPSC